MFFGGLSYPEVKQMLVFYKELGIWHQVTLSLTFSLQNFYLILARNIFWSLVQLIWLGYDRPKRTCESVRVFWVGFLFESNSGLSFPKSLAPELTTTLCHMSILIIHSLHQLFSRIISIRIVQSECRLELHSRLLHAQFVR